MPENLGTFLRMAEDTLSREAYIKVIHIVEKDLGCVIDGDLKGDPGTPGTSFSGEIPEKYATAEGGE